MADTNAGMSNWGGATGLGTTGGAEEVPGCGSREGMHSTERESLALGVATVLELPFEDFLYDFEDLESF